MLMLDSAVPEERREQVADETRKRIESDGALKQADTWGTRKLAFEIARATEAEYRFYRFDGEGELLRQLDHTLKITDGVLRYRIFKVDPGAPTSAPPPTAQPAGVSTRAARAEAKRADQPEPEEGDAPAAEPAAPAEAEDSAEAGESAESAESGDSAQVAESAESAEATAEPTPETPAEAPAEPAEPRGSEPAPDQQPG